MKTWWLPFVHAMNGIRQAVKEERHMKVHFLIGLIVLLVAFYLPLTSTERAILCLTVGVVLSAEMFNTAFERTVDLVTQEWHPLAKAAKDIASGAVLVLALTSIAIALCIFVPYLVQ
ncbi:MULTISPECIES: diacylglycerol kinase family protein [Exiguobacterium]|uniref:Diacylglycerol kinase family protein n=1 Tax=Exiguobacterium antarcticum TaxID=132920 RepID=A0ABT6QZE5_9BACL|nr:MULTISPECIES: diacylglycerol kinase family protein [Exiguobacterium]AFS69940.1 Diacylglycerol kinase [Exiguobacterium antarcticum B7]MCT4780795.1 diacylglycerol kinase family protein [Exiguobacterium soli]MDI3234062.1 diacylglycerol kinase family protein [Exiguobacterium antarcticum]